MYLQDLLLKRYEASDIIDLEASHNREEVYAMIREVSSQIVEDMAEPIFTMLQARAQTDHSIGHLRSCIFVVRREEYLVMREPYPQLYPFASLSQRMRWLGRPYNG